MAQDLEPFGDLPDGFDFAVDHDTRTASVSGDGFGTRSAVYNGDQGCTILPEGFEDVAFEPVVVERRGPDPETTAWPTGNVDAYHDPPPAGVDMAAVEATLDRAMAQTVGEREDLKDTRLRPTARCCGRWRHRQANSVRVCSPASRRVASLRPRFAGLTALTPAPRTLVQTGSC